MYVHIPVPLTFYQRILLYYIYCWYFNTVYLSLQFHRESFMLIQDAEVPKSESYSIVSGKNEWDFYSRNPSPKWLFPLSNSRLQSYWIIIQLFLPNPVYLRSSSKCSTAQWLVTTVVLRWATWLNWTWVTLKYTVF